MNDLVVDCMVKNHFTLTYRLFVSINDISLLGSLNPNYVKNYLIINKGLFYRAILEGSSSMTSMYSYNDIVNLPPMKEVAKALGMVGTRLPCFVDKTGRIIKDVWLETALQKYRTKRITETPDFPELPEEHIERANRLYKIIGKFSKAMSNEEKIEIVTKLFKKGVVVQSTDSNLKGLMLNLRGVKRGRGLVVRIKKDGGNIYYVNLQAPIKKTRIKI